MNEVVREWLDKAERDYATAGRELQAADMPNYDAIAFHAQQCVEKLLKALLIENGLVPPKTHDLVYLSSLVIAVCPRWSSPTQELRFLTRAAVDLRYPGEMADRQQAQQAFEIAGRLREELIQLVRETQ